MALARWWVEITYRTDKGPCIVGYDIEEIEELHDIVELGPDWHSIMDIHVKLQDSLGPVTVEVEAARRMQ